MKNGIEKEKRGREKKESELEKRRERKEESEKKKESDKEREQGCIRNTRKDTFLKKNTGIKIERI